MPSGKDVSTRTFFCFSLSLRFYISSLKPQLLRGIFEEKREEEREQKKSNEREREKVNPLVQIQNIRRNSMNDCLYVDYVRTMKVDGRREKSRELKSHLLSNRKINDDVKELASYICTCICKYHPMVEKVIERCQFVVIVRSYVVD